MTTDSEKIETAYLPARSMLTLADRTTEREILLGRIEHAKALAACELAEQTRTANWLAALRLHVEHPEALSLSAVQVATLRMATIGDLGL